MSPKMQKVGKHTNYPEDFFWANEILHNIAGLWLHKSKTEPKWRKYLKIFWIILARTTAIVFFILQILILKETARDIYKFFSHIGLLMSNALTIFKALLSMSRNKEIKKIVDTLNDKKYQYESLGEFKPGLIFLEAKKFSQLCTILIFSLYILAGVSAHISSTLQIHKNIKGTHFEEPYRCQDFIPYYFFMPIETDTKIKCNYILFFMDFSLFAFSSVAACLDSFLIALLNCLKTHLVILCEAIKLIRRRVRRRLELDEDLRILYDESMPAFEEQLYEELKNLTKHLTVLLSVAQELEKLFNVMILAQTLTSLFNVISCLFNATKVSVGSAEFGAIVEYFICMLLQLALLSWFGDEVTRTSEKIMFALYDSDWLSASPRFKKSILLTMCRMQRPIYLTIGKFFPLTLEATVSVCKASFSYYTVFSAVEE